jgi:hypothetical protein
VTAPKGSFIREPAKPSTNIPHRSKTFPFCYELRDSQALNLVYL